VTRNIAIINASGQAPTRVTIERGDMEQTFIFSDFRLDVGRDVMQIDATVYGDREPQFITYMGDEHWRLEGQGRQVSFGPANEPVVDKYVRAWGWLDTLSRSIGFPIDNVTESQIRMMVSKIHEWKLLEQRMEMVNMVIAGESVHLAGAACDDEVDSRDHD